MSALTEFGLGADADERDVKRAYARRLKTARPEDDPAAYQILRETYEAALAAVRYRIAQSNAALAAVDAGGSADRSPEDLSAGSSISAPRKEPASMPGAVHSAGEAKAEAADGGSDTGKTRFVLDLGVFNSDLQEQASTLDAAQFRAWLTRVLDAWPLDVKPAVSGLVLNAINTAHDTISSENLLIIKDMFGWDEAVNLIDPLNLMEYERIVAVRERFECGEKLRKMLANGNREMLCTHMSGPWRGGYDPRATRMFAIFLTSPFPRITAWIVRRIPFLGSAVRNFVTRFADGDPQLLGVAIDKQAAALWLGPRKSWQEYLLSLLTPSVAYFWVWVAFFGFINVIGYMYQGGSLSFGHDTITIDEFLTNIYDSKIKTALTRQNAGFPEEAKQIYDEIISETPAHSTLSRVRVAVRALFNRAKILRMQGKFEEALKDYAAIRERYYLHKDAQIDYYIIEAIVNEARTLSDLQRFAEAERAADRLVFDKSTSFSADNFEKFADALEIKLSSAEKQDDADHLRQACHSVVKRYGSIPHAVVRAQVNRAREILRTLTPLAGPP